MPAKFLRAIKRGARVRTVVGPSKRWGLRAGQYRRIAWPKGNGGPIWGEARRRKDR